MDMPFGIFSIYGVLKLPEFLAYDWSIFSCLNPLVTKLEVLCGDMTGPLCGCKNCPKVTISGKIDFFYKGPVMLPHKTSNLVTRGFEHENIYRS